MAIRSFCRPDFGFILEHETIAEAAIKMRNIHAGALIVVEQRGIKLRPIGVITDRDIVVRGVARHPSTNATLRVSEVMSSEPVVAEEDESLEDVLTRMRSKGVRRAPVVDREGALVGLFELDDFIELISRELSGLSSLISMERRIERRSTIA